MAKIINSRVGAGLALFIISWAVLILGGFALIKCLGGKFDDYSKELFWAGVITFLISKIVDLCTSFGSGIDTNHMNPVKWVWFWLLYLLDMSTPVLFISGFYEMEVKCFFAVAIITSILSAMIYSRRLNFKN